MQKSGESTLLITSAIQPRSGVPFLAISDPGSRLLQTYCSLVSWIQEPNITDVVLCDNTDTQHDFTALKEFAGRRNTHLEVLVFNGNQDLIVERGKGYGEGEIVQHALLHSRLLERCGSFYKVTGRVYVENFAEIHRKHEAHPVVFDYQVRPWKKKLFHLVSHLPGASGLLNDKYILTSFYKCNKAYYEKNLMLCYREVNDRAGRWLEKTFYLPLIRNGFRSFEITPRLIGRSGSCGQLYGSSDFSATIVHQAKDLLLSTKVNVCL